MTPKFPRRIKQTDGTDLFFKAFYKDIRKLRLILERDAGGIDNICDLCAFANDEENFNLTKEKRKKLIIIEAILKQIKTNTENSIKETKKILELYDGFEIPEIYEADTETLLQQENPLTH